MDRTHLLQEVEALAERLLGSEAFREVFGPDDIDFDITSLDDETLQYIFEEYCQEDDK
jgi:hypothetical protein